MSLIRYDVDINSVLRSYDVAYQKTPPTASFTFPDPQDPTRTIGRSVAPILYNTWQNLPDEIARTVEATMENHKRTLPEIESNQLGCLALISGFSVRAYEDVHGELPTLDTILENSRYLYFPTLPVIRVQTVVPYIPSL